MRSVVSRGVDRDRRRPFAFVLALAVVFAGSLTTAQARLETTPGYPLRIVLPSSRPQAVPVGADAGTMPSPLGEMATAEPEREAPDDAVPPPASTLPVPTAAPPRSVGAMPGVMALRYSLAGGADAGDTIEVEKTVSVGGNDAGRIPLRIDGNARVYALGSRLAAIIAARSGEGAVPQGLGKDYVSLEGLRSLGIGVRYDAARDRLVVDPPAA